MDHGAAEPRGEEKLRLILDQVASIRGRLNALALQQGLFGALTFILGAAVLIVGAAFAFGPLTFLLLGIAITAAALAGVARTAGGAWRMRTSDERAARIADERGALKGRLTTMVDAARVARRSALWPYLVEDTLALREEFVAIRIEPRRVSRWLWAALVSCAVAAVVMRLAYRVRTARLVATNHVVGAVGEPSADLGDLDIRPADPSAEPGSEIDADPATLRKLADKLREAQSRGQRGNPTSRLMANARDAASALQNKLTGSTPAEPAPRLRLTDRKGGNAGKGQAQDQNHQQGHQQASGHQVNPQNPGDGQQSDQNQTQPNDAPTPAMPDVSALAALNGLNSDDPNPSGSSAQKTPPDSRKLPQGGPMGAGGSDHGTGSDPRHLYGEAEQPPLGNDTFKIPVEAGPSEDGSSNTAPASPPQRTKSALNASQAPDEPFERAAIPASDRVTIKRVFER
ncbi:MAG TPA: hypothetical protein VNF49_02215 [Candidatus Binataceae bacterium]|nr:hypothetical protein [Candidatus Binataceae bacterium]